MNSDYSYNLSWLFENPEEIIDKNKLATMKWTTKDLIETGNENYITMIISRFKEKLLIALVDSIGHDVFNKHLPCLVVQTIPKHEQQICEECSI